MIGLEAIHLRAGEFRLDDLSLRVETGEYLVLMGKTGSGKTTILETVCGLKPPLSGRVVLMGRDVTQRKAAERQVGYVPQDGALFRTMTVRDHLEFAPRIRGWPRRRIGQQVEELASLLGIGRLLGRRPVGLSGGEAQRVALGRALSFEPPVLCLDEPLSALDEQTREEMFELLDHVRRHRPVTTLHVTHNSGEAVRLADRVVRLAEGRLHEVDKQRLRGEVATNAANGNGTRSAPSGIGVGEES